MSPIQNNLFVFETHIDDLVNIVNSYEVTLNIGSFLNNIIDWTKITEEQKRSIGLFFKKKDIQVQSLNNALFVSIVAEFESFLVITIRSILDKINLEQIEFKKINDKLISKHIELTGKILSNFYNPPQQINIDFYSICRNIGSCFPDTKSYTLNTEIALFIKQILELESFFEFCTNCNYNISFDIISNDTTLRNVFGTTKVRETSNTIKDYLKETLKNRNRIAHTGQSASDISNKDLRNAAEKFKILAKAIVLNLR